MDFSNAHKAHPWHGISLGNNVPEEVRAFIEIVPTDTVKYEVDKESGYLTIDRPQKCCENQQNVINLSSLAKSKDL